MTGPLRTRIVLHFCLFFLSTIPPLWRAVASDLYTHFMGYEHSIGVWNTGHLMTRERGVTHCGLYRGCGRLRYRLAHIQRNPICIDTSIVDNEHLDIVKVRFCAGWCLYIAGR